jgi:hypothetical protein
LRSACDDRAPRPAAAGRIAAALLGVFLVGCAGASVTAPTERLAFTDHGATQMSSNDGGPRIVVATDARGRAELATLLPSVPQADDRAYVAVFAGSQRTGGYAVRVDAVERTGDRLVVHATFTAPAPGALTIQVLTSPAHLVSVASTAVVGVREAVVVDQSGAERARGSVTQSRS